MSEPEISGPLDEAGAGAVRAAGSALVRPGSPPSIGHAFAVGVETPVGTE